MTLDKHQIDGLSPISSKIMPAEVFEQLMFNAGYTDRCWVCSSQGK